MRQSETKENHSSRTQRTVAVIDYDGCGVNLDNSVEIQNKINQIRTQSLNSANKKFQDYTSLRIPPDQALRQLDDYIAQHASFPMIQNHLEKLKAKVNDFQETYFKRDVLSKKEIKTGYNEFKLIFEELTTHLFMGQLLKAGYKIGQALTLINGSARQSANLDRQNNLDNGNGLLKDALPQWKSKLEQYHDYFPNHNSISINTVTSLDMTDNDPQVMANPYAPRRVMRLHENCKLGLLLSQTHCMARLHPNDELRVVAFDDRYDSLAWSYNGGTHDIEKSMRIISANPVVIPSNVTFKAVGFDSNAFFYNNPVHLKTLCTDLGIDGCVQGTGPTRSRDFTDELLKCSQFQQSLQAFTALRQQSEQLISNACNPNQGNAIEPWHAAASQTGDNESKTDNTSPPRPSTADAAESQSIGCLTALCRKLSLCFFSNPPHQARPTDLLTEPLNPPSP